jgi:glycerophosphoryl diester phosphodiesterase
MEDAVRAGVLAIETDVRATEDGELIISHEPKAGGHHIKRTPFATIRRDCPDRPLLREILDSLAGKVSFNIEIKIAPPEAVGEMLASYGILEDTLITSFREDMVEGVKRAFPAAQVGSLRWTLFNENHALHKMKEIGMGVIALHFQAINEDNVFILHGMGLEVHAWTVNEDDQARRLHALGVDCLITDRYLDMVRLVEELEAGN